MFVLADLSEIGILVAIILAVFLAWLIPSWFVAMHAERKGYSFWGFLVLGMLVSWPIALAASLLLDNRGSSIRCPECAETVRAAANVCKHCGHRLDAAPAVS
jgi:DNA-directed RNA polymerase subunit RPC12/RpoP